MRIMFDEVQRNKTGSFFLVLIFFLLIAVIGIALGYLYGDIFIGLYFAVFITIIYSLISYYSGDQMILSMSGARPVTKAEYPYLFHTLEGLTISAGLKYQPKAYVIDDSALNAFATGRDPEHSSIVVTTGLLNALNRQELEGVVAHEMSHIKNYDIRFMMLAAILVGVFTFLADIFLRSLWHGNNKGKSKGAGILIIVGIVLALLSPIIGQIIKLAISRKREYMADASAVVLTRYPEGLANALKKISKDPDPLVDNANKATAHLFISTPFRDQKGFIVNLFSTHPPIEERIKRLKEM
jgi:heat shock protein HtpX